MGEILSCLKDSNKKSRDLSLNLLKYLVCQLPTEDSLLLLGSAIVGETASLRVGGVTGLCILLLEKRSDMSLLSQVISALDTVCYLLKNESVEESRAVLSFLRVCANVLPSNLLIPILPKFVPTVTSGLGILKPKFTSRIRAIMRKLIQKCGESSIRPCVTEIDIPLFDYIVKQSRRVKKKKHQKLAYEKSQLDKMLGSDSEDSEDNNKDDEDMVDSHRRTRVRAKRPIDYILHMPHSLQEFVEGAEGPSGPDERYSVKVSAEGKVVVCETDVHEEVHADVEERHENERSRERVSFSGGKKPRTREPGAEYRSARAGGDVWRKGMLEPHAYIPLEPKLLNKKRRHEALGTFASVVKNRNKTGKKSKAPRFVKNMKLSKKK
jgi:ribosomal RNA-processing protein 12